VSMCQDKEISVICMLLVSTESRSISDGSNRRLERQRIGVTGDWMDRELE